MDEVEKERNKLKEVFNKLETEEKSNNFGKYEKEKMNLGPGEDGKYHEIPAVIAGFGEYNLKEIVQEFRDSASPTELEYVLPETVGGTKVHLLLGIKNTRFQVSL